MSVTDLNADNAKSIGLPSPKGALITDVVNSSPAAQAGLKHGDVVLAYQDKPIADASTLRNDVADTPKGQDVRLIVWRNKKQETATIRIGGTEDSVKLLSAAVDERLGITFRPITPKDDEKYGIKPSEGVAVATVRPKGPFGQIGMEPKDFILQVNGQVVKGTEGFADLLSSLPAKQPLAVLSLDHRSGPRGYVQVQIN